MRASVLLEVAVAVAVAALIGCGDNHGLSAECGNAVVEPGEDCDAGGAAAGNCTASCRWSCASAADCDDGDPCNGAEVCADHACAAGARPDDGTSCGTAQICRAGACMDATCGDGFVTGTDECDDANTVDGDGCETNCRFSCVSADPSRNCAPEDACAGQGTCNDATHVCAAGTPLPNGEACAAGPNHYCSAGVCTAPVCGNSFPEPGEDCDGGAGCAADCTFLCVDDPATECSGSAPACMAFACGPAHTCDAVADPSQNGLPCDPANPSSVCLDGACQPTSCGNGTIDPGETCEPPGSQTCDASCQLRCGNGVRDPGEDCDDGGRLNLDGCDAVCKFEQSQRLTSLLMQWDTDAFCPANALGSAFTPDAQSVIQTTFDLPVADGSMSLAFKFLGLTDLSGTNATFTLGFLNTVPVPDPAYDGTNDLDWWHVREPGAVDETETPTVQLPGQIVANHLTAGPGTVEVKILFALEPAEVTLYGLRVDALVDGPVNAPTISSNGMTPGHLPSMHLDPALTSFASSTVGALCANVSVASLQATVMPELLRTVCTGPDGITPLYDTSHTLLDGLINGCAIFGIPGIVGSQPDGSLDGASYQFQLDSTLHIASCTRNGVAASLTQCFAQATYSSYFKYTANRVIIKRN